MARRTGGPAGRGDQRLEAVVTVAALVLENGHGAIIVPPLPETALTQDALTVLALKNAWNGAIAASDRLRELASSVERLGTGGEGTTDGADPGLTPADLAQFHAAALAQAIAAEALRGLLEELQRKAGGST